MIAFISVRVPSNSLRPSIALCAIVEVHCGKMRSLEGRAQAYLLTTITLCLRLSPLGYCSDAERQNCRVLQLLNVQPFPDDGMFAGFDRGLDLIPAAHLAAKEINNRSDILAGFNLEIVDIDSEACGRGIITKGLVNFYRELVSQDPSQCIVGVMGFVCSSVTNVLAPIIGRQNVGYVILANSVSPAHRNTVEYPNLFHTISSSSVHNTVLISLMQNFGWNKIGLVYDSLSIFYRSTANDFVRMAKTITEVELSVNVPITTLESISEAFNIINSEAARITYWLGNDDQNALCLCEAHQREFLYPGHVFILRYHEKIVENILKASTVCSEDELLHAMEGVILMDYRLYVDDDTTLFSGWSYDEFRGRYADELDEFASEINETLSVNLYANSFYDQVWTFALALNNSIPLIGSKNFSLSDYTIGNTREISSIFRHELMNLSFQGASGWIKFNKENEIPSFVNIFQVINGTPTLVAIYNPIMQNVTFLRDIQENIPDDMFDTIYMLLPNWLVGSILTAQAILFCLITTNTLLLVLWRKEKEIKAMSPVLSVLMIIGCYLLWAAPIILMVYRTVVIKNMMALTFLCNLKAWLLVGSDFIFATLLIRMLRIQHIFRAKQMTVMSNYWLDKYLFMYIIAICAGKLILLTVLTAANPTHPHVSKQYVVPVNVHRLPYYRATVYCSSSSPQVWLALTLFYSGVVLFMVMLLAIMTRHIKKGVYKDTKKVNVFIFSVVLSLAITLLLWFVFLESGTETGVNITEWLASFSISTLCQACIFVPKLLPLAIKKIFICTLIR